MPAEPPPLRDERPAWVNRLLDGDSRAAHRGRPDELTAVRDDRGELVALASEDRVWFPPAIEALDGDHPRRRFAAMLSLVAVLMQTGEGSEPYDPEAACFYTRYILIPDTSFVLHAGCESDVELAERFKVPLEQIRAKRTDIGLLGFDVAA